ncbi:capsule assembly Wzi family protein [Mucilaginibacter sp. UC70_90]
MWHVLIGQVYHHSKVGNHLGSLDVGAEYRFDGVNVLLYRQNLYDKGALSSLANIADGLNGLSITNTRPGNGNFYWKKMVFEVLYTANQAGALDAKRTNSGYENYYNNYEYAQGWSYKAVGLGSPFITTRQEGRIIYHLPQTNILSITGLRCFTLHHSFIYINGFIRLNCRIQ